VTTRLTVTVPAGISGGDLVRVAAPDGSYHSVMVPSGLTAGQQFSVELLAGHAEGSAVELSKLRVRSAPRHRRAAAVDAAAAAQVELEAERHLRRETQQEALRARTVRSRLPRAPFCPHPRAPRRCVPQALDALEQKRTADHAFFRDLVKRQRRCIEHLSQQLPSGDG